jgi:nucleotide-binding universal stress UspA family protein
MARQEHILFPVDFSPQVDAAIPFVASLARKLNATVTLLSVVPPMWAGRGPRPSYADELEVSTKKRLDSALTAEVHGLSVTRAVVSGEPAEEILAYAKTHAVDLIIMPTHGYGTFRSLLIGSVAAKVLHDSPCPVWTAAHTSEQSAKHVPEKLICCVDGGPSSVEQLRWAAGFADLLGSTLHVLHVVPLVTDWGPLAGDRELQEEQKAAARQRIEDLCKEAQVSASLHVESGKIADVVSASIVAQRADLVVIGRGHVGAKLGRLRTHAYEIIRHSPCPVMSV